MGGSSFDLIMQEVFNQKQRMEELTEENRDLHRQLLDLCDGRGIFLEIYGKKFALVGEQVVASPQAGSTAQNSPTVDQETIGMALNESPTNTVLETPPPGTNEFEQISDYYNHEVEEVEEVQKEGTALTPTPTFLEEMLIDEFASASTSQLPVATWQDSGTSKPLLIDEEEKATLRKELIGSFLLE